eukprot:6173064-Pleurochrysis_carterae.AAC.2
MLPVAQHNLYFAKPHITLSNCVGQTYRCGDPNLLSPYITDALACKISVPLVWRYLWDAAKKHVLVQCKVPLADKATFEQYEWDPWEYKMVNHIDKATGTTAQVQVSSFRVVKVRGKFVRSHVKLRVLLFCVLSPTLRSSTLKCDLVGERSTAHGVEIVRSYPDVKESPGVEDWLPQDKCSMSRVFDSMQRWAFADITEPATCDRRQWESLHAWHTAYGTFDCIAMGMMHDVDATDSLQFDGYPAMSA